MNCNLVSPDSKEEQEDRLLAALPYAATATFNDCRWEGEPLCLAGTRMQLLADIMSWARGAVNSGGIGSVKPSGDNSSAYPHRIFWLDGMAGTGKSTIARTVARRCSDAGLLGASFFFSRGGGELETARMLVTTLAVQLARRHPLLRTAVCAAVRAQPDIARQLLGDQWRHLVLGPCERLASATAGAPSAPAPPLPLVVVIDALNECKSSAEAESVLELLSDFSGFSLKAPLRIFLTSRPETVIRAGLHNASERHRRHVILHHVEPVIVNQVIGLFFEQNLAALIPTRPMLLGFRDEEVLRRLVTSADGLFVWAATACRYIKEGGPYARRRLGTIVEQRDLAAATGPERKLDEIYTSVLCNAIREDWTVDEGGQFCHLLNEVLGTIAVVFSSLSAPSLARLLYRSETEVLDALCDLHSILDIPKHRSAPIRPQHLSVREYLLSHQRCTDTRFRVDEGQAHTRVARQCLLLMTQSLKKNICGLREPSARVEDVDQALLDECVPTSLRYACLYWVQHVEKCHNRQSFRKSVDRFMRKHLLHWLEALAWIGKVYDGVPMVALLCSIYVC